MSVDKDQIFESCKQWGNLLWHMNMSETGFGWPYYISTKLLSRCFNYLGTESPRLDHLDSTSVLLNLSIQFTNNYKAVDN